MCVDDVCCNSACTQQCEACDLPQALGTCSPVSGDPHGARASCASDGSACGGSCNGSRRDACDYPDASTVCRLGSCSNGVATVAAFCDGSGFCPALSQRACAPFVCAANACLGDCAEDDDCATGSVCEAGICTAKRALGQSCASASVCASGFCVDGVCCNENCRGQCEACDAAGTTGTCTPVTGAPRGNRPACDGDGSACTGACGGSDRDGCVYPSAATACRTAGCVDGIATLAASCVGTGACPGLQQQLCTPYRCGATACAGDCVNSQDCQSDYYCSAGVCVARLAGGASCGADDQCQSGACSDGYCCDGRCDGQCEACDLAGHIGQCTAVVGAPHAGRAACAGTGTCAGACDGSARRDCKYPGAELTCSAAACGGGVATSEASCDGAGACREPERQVCSPYPCAATSCANSCSNDSECANGYTCRAGECQLAAEPDAGPVDAGGAEPEADAAVPDAGSNEPQPPAAEPDSDGDGIPDAVELGTGQEPRDSDRDGIPDYLDADDDNDSIPTSRERGRRNIDNDLDGDGIPNHLDTDSDGDGVPDREEAKGDSDGDGIPDFRDEPSASSGGGGMCSIQPAAHRSSAPAWLVFGLALCWFARRRRWQLLSLVLALAALPPRAAAESFRLDQYLAPALPDDGLQVERPIALDRAAASLLLTFDYADDPLVVELEQGIADTERAQLVHSQLQGGLRFAYGVHERLSVTAGVDFIP
ncbi:MAG TPA: hypothetical protein VJR89_30500, partial [Polyangiales bacterium]|nr:hypothetical protein [Polyangiales bacterium]